MQGITVKQTTPPLHAGPVIRAAGPVSTIVIQIDPETLRDIFEYVVALMTLHKGKPLIEAFVKGAFEKLGSMAGAKIAEVISKLWASLFERISELSRGQKQARVYLTLTADIEGTYFKAEALVSTDEVKSLSRQELEWLKNQATLDLILFVIPISRRIVEEAMEWNRQFKSIEAQLLTRGSVLDRGQWQLQLDQLACVRIEPDGYLQGSSGRVAWDDIPNFVAKTIT